MVDYLQVLLAAAMLWAPGLACTWAFAPRLDWAKFLAASVIVSLSVPTSTLYVAHVFFGVPITPMNAILVALTWTTLGLALGLWPRLERAVD